MGAACCRWHSELNRMARRCGPMALVNLGRRLPLARYFCRRRPVSRAAAARCAVGPVSSRGTPSPCTSKRLRKARRHGQWIRPHGARCGLQFRGRLQSHTDSICVNRGEISSGCAVVQVSRPLDTFTAAGPDPSSLAVRALSRLVRRGLPSARTKAGLRLLLFTRCHAAAWPVPHANSELPSASNKQS